MQKILLAILVAVLMTGCNTNSAIKPTLREPAAVTTAESVPMPDTYFIGGTIERGGVYAFVGREMTLLQAVTSAGGSHGRIECFVDIIRHTGHTAEFIRGISVGAILAGKRADVLLESGDVINVLPGPVRPL